ncbi:MAG TPA: hypothetical protein VK620_31485 [Bradyrhizobium sp.]|jgi:hypothetical protein|nr:hypothetical protein [Bradyrhizobium sp.]
MQSAGVAFQVLHQDEISNKQLGYAEIDDAGPESANRLRQLDRGNRMGGALVGHAGGRVAAGVPGRFAALGKQDPPVLQSDSNDARAIGS